MKIIMNKYFSILRIIFYIIFFTFFILVPISHFQTSHCISYVKLNYLCPTCGVTRAFISIMHLDFFSAFDFNTVFTLAICPICVIIFMQDVYTIIGRIITKKNKKSIIEYYLTDFLK